MRFLLYFALGFRFSAKIKSVYRIYYSMRFGVFLISPGKICASTTSTACTSSLILLAVFGFDRNIFRFCGFLLLIVRFCGVLYTPMPSSWISRGREEDSASHLDILWFVSPVSTCQTCFFFFAWSIAMRHQYFYSVAIFNCLNPHEYFLRRSVTEKLVWGLPRCKNLWYFFFVSLARTGVWLLFNGLLALLFSLFYVVCEFDRFSHRGWALVC